MHICIPSHALQRSWRSHPRRVHASNTHTPSMHHPLRWDMTTSVVELKTVTYTKISPQNGAPHRYSWGTQKMKKKKKKKKTLYGNAEEEEEEEEEEELFIPNSHDHSCNMEAHPVAPGLRPTRWPSGKASASRAECPGFESRLKRDFFGVESY